MTETPIDPIRDWLDALLSQQGAVAGTVHLLRDGVLQVAAAVNIPEPVLLATARIPRGKGMAGLAWARGQPITICNLKEDTSGTVRPGARAVEARAAVALPVHGQDGSLRAVVGLAFAEERELGEPELAALARAAAELPRG